MSDEASAVAGQKRRRTRSGCLNCRRKRKKCDEKRPRCGKCERGNETCEWDSFVKFQPPTGLPPSTNHALSGPITLHIDSDSEDTVETSAKYSPGPVSRKRDPRMSDWETVQGRNDEGAPVPGSSVEAAPLTHPQKRPCTQSPNDHDGEEMRSPSSISRASSLRHDGNVQNCLQRSSPTSALSGGIYGPCGLDGTTHASRRTVDRPAVVSPSQHSTSWSSHEMGAFVENAPLDLSQLPDHVISPSISSGYQNEDGVFEPGSRYRDLFKELRSQVIKTAHFDSTPSNDCTSMASEREASTAFSAEAYNYQHPRVPDFHKDNDELNTLPPFKLPPAQEFLLWKAWTEEVSGWLDKYDPQTHFRDTFPIIAKGRPHLKYAMLSLSARYLETRNKKIPPSLTLALYQHSIQLLVPQLYMRDIAVIASCVVLCVLEMFSCSPKAWRRHLDGCASLMQSLNLRGDSGGPEEAVFWCFARMDLCGGLISLERTLIPVEKWTSESISEVTVTSYPRTGAFQDYAKMISNLIAQAMDLFASFHASEGAFGFASANQTQNEAYGERWRYLFDNVLEWFDTRPTEMLPVMSMSAKESGSAFPTVLYSNAAAISGNQFAHTAAIMMLQRKPRDMTLGKVRSILWHARQICGIALSNDHHGAWTNTVQPIWIAGRLMSHPQEHAAIVALLRRIEMETGWATQWRIDDLMEHWGDPDD